jgi:hypothetical protein
VGSSINLPVPTSDSWLSFWPLEPQPLAANPNTNVKANSAPTFDIWVGGGKILALTAPEEGGVCPNVPGLVEIDVTGMTIVPGFIDCHVHVTGGGGEAGFASRTPEAQLGELVNAGVTTFVGILGTDCVTRSTENLLAKTRGLAAGGLTGYCLLGGYQFPPVNDITGSLSRDIMLIPEAIGVGELAISDHRRYSYCTRILYSHTVLAYCTHTLYSHTDLRPSQLEPDSSRTVAIGGRHSSGGDARQQSRDRLLSFGRAPHRYTGEMMRLASPLYSIHHHTHSIQPLRDVVSSSAIPAGE